MHTLQFRLEFVLDFSICNHLIDTFDSNLVKNIQVLVIDELGK